jgi:hypothetical protein
MFLAAGKRQYQVQFRRHPVGGGQADDELLEKTPQDEQQRLQRLDLVFKLDFFLVNGQRRDQTQEPLRAAGGALPESLRLWPQAGGERFLRESGQSAERVDAPLLQDRRQWTGGLERRHRQIGQKSAGIGDGQEGIGVMGGQEREIGIFGQTHAGGEMEPREMRADILGAGAAFPDTPPELERADPLARRLDPGRAGKAAFEQGGGGGGFPFRGAREQAQIPATRQALAGGHPSLHAGGLGGFGQLQDERLVGGAFREHRDGLAMQFRLVPQGRLEGEIGQ